MKIIRVPKTFVYKTTKSFQSLWLDIILAPFLIICRHRSLLYQTTLNEVRARYAGSALGFLWLIIYPLLFLLTYAIVYLFIFKIRFPELSSYEYIAIIFCGLIPFLGFSEGLSLGVVSVVANSNLIKNTLFPIELVPVKSVFVGQATQIAATGILVISLGFLGKLSFYSPLFLVVWFCQILLTQGLVWILSSLNVYLRDIQNIVPIAIMLLMMLSPIAYTESMVPENIRLFLSLNPLYYLIISYRSVLMLASLPSLQVTLTMFTVSIFLFIIGFFFFLRMKQLFSDHI